MKRIPSSTSDVKTMIEVHTIINLLCSLSSHNHVDAYFGEFEKHTWGIGSNFLTKMDFDGKDLGINGQGMNNPIQVEEIPHYVGLGYRKGEVGEFSKTFEEREYPKPLDLQKQPI